MHIVTDCLCEFLCVSVCVSICLCIVSGLCPDGPEHLMKDVNVWGHFSKSLKKVVFYMFFTEINQRPLSFKFKIYIIFR